MSCPKNVWQHTLMGSKWIHVTRFLPDCFLNLADFAKLALESFLPGQEAEFLSSASSIVFGV